MNGLVYDPRREDVGLDPHALFKRLRDEAPLYRNEERGFYALSRFDDVEAAHVDRETFISSRGATLDLLEANVEFPPGTVIFEDPPTHTIHRALLSRMFTPRKVAWLAGSRVNDCTTRMPEMSSASVAVTSPSRSRTCR